MTNEFIAKISELATANGRLTNELTALRAAANVPSLSPTEGAALLAAIREYGLNCAKRTRVRAHGTDVVQFWANQETLATAIEAKLFPKAGK